MVVSHDTIVKKRQHPSVKTACDLCRARKVRCEGGFPCRRCVFANAPCTVNSKQRFIVNNNNNSRSSAAATSSSSTSNSKSSSAKSSSSNSNNNNTSRSSSKGEDSWDVLYLDEVNSLVHSGRSSGVPLMAHLGGLPNLRTTERDQQDSAQESTPDYATSTSTESSDVDVWNAILNTCPLDLLDKLIRNHLSKTENMWPIIHEPSFLKIYLHVREGRIPCTPQFGTLLLSICALTSRSSNDERVFLDSKNTQTAGLKFFYLAKGFCRYCQDRLNLHFIKALFYMALYTEGLGQTSVYDSIIGEAVALCLQTGMHLTLDKWSFNPIVSELRKRLFWSIWSLDKATACNLGRPPLIRMDDCTVSLPKPIDDIYITQHGISENPSINIARLACNATVHLNRIVECILLAINTPSHSERDSQDEATNFLYSMTGEPQLRYKYDRDYILKKCARLLQDWKEFLPQVLRVPSDLSTLSFHGDPIRSIQILRLEIAFCLISALISRERIATEQKDSHKRKRTSISTTYSMDVENAEECACTMIRLYLILASNNVLEQYFGIHPIQHLYFAGHTIISLLAITHNDHPNSIYYLEQTMHLLHIRSSRYNSASKSLDLLREMSWRLKIPIAFQPQQTTSDKTWIRTLSPSNTQTAEGSSNTSSSSLSTVPEVPDVVWLQTHASPKHSPKSQQQQNIYLSSSELPSTENASFEQQNIYASTSSATELPSTESGPQVQSTSQMSTELQSLQQSQSQQPLSQPSYPPQTQLAPQQQPQQQTNYVSIQVSQQPPITTTSLPAVSQISPQQMTQVWQQQNTTTFAPISHQTTLPVGTSTMSQPQPQTQQPPTPQPSSVPVPQTNPSPVAIAVSTATHAAPSQSIGPTEAPTIPITIGHDQNQYNLPFVPNMSTYYRDSFSDFVEVWAREYQQ